MNKSLEDWYKALNLISETCKKKQHMQRLSI